VWTGVLVELHQLLHGAQEDGPILAIPLPTADIDDTKTDITATSPSMVSSPSPSSLSSAIVMIDGVRRLRNRYAHESSIWRKSKGLD
jgi:hypothetical protein